MEIIQRKIIEMDELPEGFFYFSETHMVKGTGKFVEEKEKKHEGLHPKKSKQMVLHCRYWERPTDGKEETKNPVGL